MGMSPAWYQSNSPSTNACLACTAGGVVYEGPSPDEVALADAARLCGVVLNKKSGDVLSIPWTGWLAHAAASFFKFFMAIHICWFY
jgi:hypothetical protein